MKASQNSSSSKSSEKPTKAFKWPFTFEELLNDFFDQPDCLENCAGQYFQGNHDDKIAKLLHMVKNNQFKKVLLIGNTFNYFASQIARQLYLESSKSPSFSLHCVELSEFYDYLLPPEPESTLYIFISKSGKSRFLGASIDHLRLTKVNPEHVWLITNNPNQSENGFLTNILPIYVSREIVMGTKTFINAIFVIYIITQTLLGYEILQSTFKHKFGQFILALKDYRENWQQSTKIIENYLEEFDYLYMIARDPASMGAAALGALHAKSFTRLLTEGIYISDFFHGPFQILEKKIRPMVVRTILLVGEKTTNEATIYRLVKLINQRAGKVLVLSNDLAVSDTFRDNPQVLLAEFDADIPVLAPIFEIFILQLVLLKIAKKKGLLQP